MRFKIAKRATSVGYTGEVWTLLVQEEFAAGRGSDSTSEVLVNVQHVLEGSLDLHWQMVRRRISCVQRGEDAF